MDANFFTSNRHALQDLLGGGALVVVAGYGEMQRTNDAAWPFEQEANFWYLSGIVSPDWWLIIEGGKAWAVAPSVDEVKQAFDGSLSSSEAKSISGVDRVIDRDEAVAMLRRLSRQHSLIYTTLQPESVTKHTSFYLNPAQAELEQVVERMFQKVDVCNKQLARLRTIKQIPEIAAIQHAVNNTASAFKFVKKQLAIYKNESSIEADLSHSIRSTGADGHAYSPIVATGANACTLHYIKNDSVLKRPSLLLLDVGARYHGYAADISRTYGLGKVTAKQRAVHAAVQSAQADIVNYIEPGLNIESYQQMVDKRMEQALVELKVHPSKLHELMPHAIGHGLGIDVHDTMSGYDSFQPGMVLTVEPGLYLRDEGIGVRIEDDVLVTETGRKVLSATLSTDI